MLLLLLLQTHDVCVCVFCFPFPRVFFRVDNDRKKRSSLTCTGFFSSSFVRLSPFFSLHFLPGEMTQLSYKEETREMRWAAFSCCPTDRLLFISPVHLQLHVYSSSSSSSILLISSSPLSSSFSSSSFMFGSQKLYSYKLLCREGIALVYSSSS